MKRLIISLFAMICCTNLYAFKSPNHCPTAMTSNQVLNQYWLVNGKPPIQSGYSNHDLFKFVQANWAHQRLSCSYRVTRNGSKKILVLVNNPKRFAVPKEPLDTHKPWQKFDDSINCKQSAKDCLFL